MKLFMRVVELYVDDRIFNGDDFTIMFDVPFSDSEDANVSEIKIYNLSEKTINLIKNGSRIILNAGYREDSGTILLGVAKKVTTEWAGVDKITTIQVLDGDDTWFSVPVQKTYAAGTQAEDIIKDLSTMTGIQIGAFSLPVNYTYKSGKTIKGALSNVISSIAQDCGARSHVTRGKVYIRPQGEGNNIGFKLDSASGLVSSPAQLEKEVVDKSNEAKSTLIGWNVACLLNHRITTDSIIEISSRTANGFFRVANGRHNGESFETELEVFPL